MSYTAIQVRYIFASPYTYMHSATRAALELADTALIRARVDAAARALAEVV